MSVRVMKVKNAENVDGSNNLRVYTFEAPGMSDLVVVANLTNVYDENDVVAVAQVGSVLSAYDNMEIKQRKVFGIESFGMALGCVDAELGAELGDDYCAEKKPVPGIDVPTCFGALDPGLLKKSSNE